MFLEVVGADGSKQAGNHLVSMKMGESVLLDAGSASSLTNSEQMKVEVVLLTHAHLDHILDLGFLADATASQRSTPLTVIGSEAALSIVRAHYMNDLIWPDFSVLDAGNGVSLDYRNMVDEEWLELPGGLRALPVPVNHGAGARGFIFDSGRSTIAYTGDTGPTDRIWDVAAGCENLCMVIAEVSFPDRLTDVAIASDHLSPQLLEKEMHKLNRSGIPIFAFHLKPWFRHEIERDLARRFRDRAVLLVRGDRFTF
jgi:3',5'-cyclic-nucleotide phosphodiesterase